MSEFDDPNSLLQEAVDGMFGQSDTQTVYHYTTSFGLEGILRDKKLWATHVRHLNDLSEYSLAFERAESLIKTDDALNAKYPRISDQLAVLRGHLQDQNVFVVSFSDDRGNRLSQWRGYSRGSVGYSLGFSTASLLNTCCEVGALGMELYFAPCIYKIDETDTAIRRSLDLFKQLIDQPVTGSITAEVGVMMVKKLLLEFSVAVALKAARCKHPGFYEENEWRLIAVELPTKKIPQEMRGFHGGNLAPIPHVEIPLTSGSSVLQLDEIFVGPSPHPADAKKAVEMMLEKYEVSCRHVHKSGIPYRGW